MNWSPSAKYCAEMLHVVASLAFMQQIQIQEWNQWLAGAIWIIVWAIKEFWADLTWLEHDSLKDSLLDFIMYCWGVCIHVLSQFSLGAAIVVIGVTFLVAVLIDMDSQGLFKEHNPYD